jgi:hypothetical protein
MDENGVVDPLPIQVPPDEWYHYEEGEEYEDQKSSKEE